MSRYLFLLPGLFICNYLAGQASSTFGVFKDWTTTETRVWGMVRLTDTRNREFDSIYPVDSNTVKIDEYNPARTLTSTTIVHFSNNRISAVEYINQWGLLYKTMHFTPDTTHVYRVTEMQLGRNSYLPCKEAKFVYKNDLLAETQYISFDGKLANGANGVAMVKHTFFEDPDRYGRLREMSFFDEDGLPAGSRAADYHRVVYERDRHGNQIGEEWFNEEGDKLQNRMGIFNVKSVYDTMDNETESSYYGLHGEVKKNIYGVAKTMYTYQNGLKTATIFYDENDNIINASDTGNGLAIIMSEYNNAGFITTQTYFGASQHPVNDQSGVHKRVYRYNDRNMRLEEEYFDKTGAPAVNKESIHRYVLKRNAHGREVQRSFFGIANQPCKNQVEQVHMIKYDYNAKGLLLAESFWKDENTPTRSWSGVHKIGYAYNEQGLQTETVNYDENGKLVVASSGWSRLVKKYDAGARICEYGHFKGDTPSLMMHTTIKNYHSIKLTYDEKNRVAQIEYLDTSGKPTEAQIELQDDISCYKIELKYVANRLTRELFYPKNSSFPSKTIDCLKNDFVDPHGITIGHKSRQ